MNRNHITTVILGGVAAAVLSVPAFAATGPEPVSAPVAPVVTTAAPEVTTTTTAAPIVTTTEAPKPAPAPTTTAKPKAKAPAATSTTLPWAPIAPPGLEFGGHLGCDDPLACNGQTNPVPNDDGTGRPGHYSSGHTAWYRQLSDGFCVALDDATLATYGNVVLDPTCVPQN